MHTLQLFLKLGPSHCKPCLLRRTFSICLSVTGIRKALGPLICVLFKGSGLGLQVKPRWEAPRRGAHSSGFKIHGEAILGPQLTENRRRSPAGVCSPFGEFSSLPVADTSLFTSLTEVGAHQHCA